jgi:cyclopropane fatty-acyl-phospholipid synthase-like methyltransferase
MDKNLQKVVLYYDSLGSRLGYKYFLWGSQHFGFYPNKKADITEKEAQVFYNELVAKSLDIQKGQKILDAGCGQGVVSSYLAEKYDIKIWGITIVPAEVKKAKNLASKMNIQNRVNYEVMDYSKTNFSANFFDSIYTNETLSHSPDVVKTLKEFMRILKPGGKLVLFEYTLSPDEKFDRKEKEMVNIVSEGSGMMGLKSFRHDKFTGVLKNTGFIDTNEQNITENTKPSLHRLYKFSELPYKLIEFLNLQKTFINITAGFEFYKMAEKDLIRYSIFTANKPE